MTTSLTNDAGTGQVQADGFIGAGTGPALFPNGATITGGTTTGGTISGGTFTGVSINKPQILAAVGATQGGAGVITSSMVIVTVTASTEGVKLPTATTGKTIQVMVPGTIGVKVYPFAGDRISTAATNAAVALVADKANIYVAKDTVTWAVMKGA